MSQENPYGPQSGVRPGARSGVNLGGLVNELVMAGRLLFDSRVPGHLKLLLPVAALLYWLWPLDLMPGLPFDDVALVALAVHFFVRFASQAVQQAAPGTGTTPRADQQEGTVVDTTWRVIE